MGTAADNVDSEAGRNAYPAGGQYGGTSQYQSQAQNGQGNTSYSQQQYPQEPNLSPGYQQPNPAYVPSNNTANPAYGTPAGYPQNGGYPQGGGYPATGQPVYQDTGRRGLHWDWIFFILGFVTVFCWWIGACLVIRRVPKFSSSGNKIAWMLNVLMTVLSIAAIIALSIWAGRRCRNYNCRYGNGYYRFGTYYYY